MKKNYKTFDIEIPETVKKILVSFSGGTESLLTLYTICDYIKTYNLDISVSCVHGLDRKDCPESLYNVDKILSNIKQIFNLEIPLYIFEYKGVNNKLQIHSQNISQIIQLHKFDMIVYGSSANPKRKIMEKIYPMDNRNNKRLNRDLKIRLTEKIIKFEKHGNLGVYNYRPLLRINKKQIAESSQLFDDLWNMQLLTRSCDRTKNGNPCKSCYACAEKRWAFGYYDGGLVE